MPRTNTSKPSRRAALLEFAILGLLHDGPLHGYELRKRLTTALGIFRALSYGSLYPALRSLVEAGHISETEPAEPPLAGKRARITYELTAEGKEHFQDLVAQSGPDAWDDDDFDVRFAFFSRTEAQVRLRILEGRRSRLEERLANIRDASQARRERMDAYTMALQQHGEDRAEREVRWLEELINAERRGTDSRTAGAAGTEGDGTPTRGEPSMGAGGAAYLSSDDSTHPQTENKKIKE